MLSFAGVILLPLALYLYLVHPAWSWMYLINPDKVPSVLLVPLLVFHGAALVGGYWLGGRLVKARRMVHGIYAAVAAALVLLVATLLSWGRLGRYGSYQEWSEGRALGLMDVKLGYVLVVATIGLGAAAVFIALQLLRDSRRATSK